MTIKSNRQVLHEQIAQGKIKQFDIQDYTATKMKRLSEKTIKEIYYMKSKNKLSSIYGMTATMPIHPDIIYAYYGYMKNNSYFTFPGGIISGK